MRVEGTINRINTMRNTLNTMRNTINTINTIRNGLNTINTIRNAIRNRFDTDQRPGTEQETYINVSSVHVQRL
jgi:hypothetical protein